MQPAQPAAAPWLALGLSAALWSLVTTASLGFFDAGELAAAAIEPGVPHPTGFPLLLLAGQLARLLPAGTLAGRVHLIGAVLGCAAAIVWLRSLPRAREHGPAAATALALAAALWAPSAPLVALHLRQTEVYPWALLHAATLAALLLGSRGPRRLVGVAALLGLGVGIHAEAVGLALAATLISLASGDLGPIGRPGPRTGRALATIGAALLALLGTAACVVALPLIAARRPALDWGAVDNLPALWSHLSGASIRVAFADRIGHAPGPAAQHLAAQLLRDAGPWLPLGLLGALLGLRRGADAATRRWVLVTLGLVALDLGWAIVVNPMGIRDGQVGLVACLGLGMLAVAAIVQLLPAARVPAANETPAPTPSARARAGAHLALPTLALVLGAGAFARGVAAMPPSSLDAAAHHGDALLDALPPAGVAVAATDAVAAACTWLQGAEGARADARCLPGVFAHDATMLRRAGERLGEADWVAAAAQIAQIRDDRDRAAALGRWLRAPARAGVLRWEPGLAFEDAQLAGVLRPGFPWGEVAVLPDAPSRTAAAADELRAKSEAFCAALGAGCTEGSPLRQHLAGELGSWGAVLVRNAPDAAATLLERAVIWAPAQARPLHNLAVVRLAQGRNAEAATLAARALDAEPDYGHAHRSAARAALRLGDQERCVRHAFAALQTGDRAANRRWLETLVREADPALAARLRAL